MNAAFRLAQLKESSGILALGFGLVTLAVLLPWISLTLDRRTWAAQARMVDLQAFYAKNPTFDREELRATDKIRNQREWVQRMDLLQRFEWNTYDWRFGQTLPGSNSPPQVALVKFDDDTITAVGYGDVIPGEIYNLFWPRMPVYGRALRELRAQGVTAVGFDVTLQDLLLEKGRMEFDKQFANELNRPGAPVVLAIAPGAETEPLFQYRAAGVGDVSAIKDADSVCRRVRAYTIFRQENPRIADLALKNEWRLKVAKDQKSVDLQTNLLDPAPGRAIQVDDQGQVALQRNRFSKELVPLLITNRVWHLGLVLAAYQMQVDLKQSDFHNRELVLRATNGAVVRRVPVDEHGFFPVNWTLQAGGGNDLGIVTRKIESLMRQDWARTNSGAVSTNDQLKGRVVVVGSTASANNLADRGPTPLNNTDFLVGTHVNVAHQLITNDLIYTPRFRWVALLMVLLSVTACVLTWNLRGAWSPLVILALGLAWFSIAVWAFVSHRLMLPIVHPLVAGLLIPYGTMVSARAVFEQRERQRVRSVFAKMVSPEIVQEMLGSGRIELGGSRRELSILFADIRGFTALTDRYQAEAEHHVKTNGLTGADAESYFDARAREVLETVNLYLGAIADVVKYHQGTLDKYIGDCVMAFWGAPVSNLRHSVHCVVAAIDAQRIIARLNARRGEENDRRTAENLTRPEAKLDPLTLLPLVSLGTGVNSGVVTVGLMGSGAHIVNYTVFGREVNLASRLEGVSGHARIVIGEATFLGLEQHAPALAQLCRPLDPVSVKGFRAPVKIYEVPWQDAETVAAQTQPLYGGTPEPGFTVLPKVGKG